MLPKRLRISKSASDTLRVLKGRTGLTPNVVCRIALLISLEEGTEGGQRRIDELGNEFNAPTLFGEYGFVFEGLLRQVHGRLETKDAAAIIVSHIDSGLERLRKSRSLLEIVQHSGLTH